MTTLEITVRGCAEQHHPAERAIVSMTASVDLADAVQAWTGDQVRAVGHHGAQVEVRAEFDDFERLNKFLDHWSGVDGVEVSGVEWDVSVASRRRYESEVRKSAVDDAVAKAQAYADAVRRGRVVPVEIADPGMLAGSAPAAPVLAASGGARDRRPVLVPAEIVIRAEIDARFRAD
ncbi:SIMPL domain-containing protein [Aeromicrobium wangtongii]|uniref:SIMPL domain-containing protein n=1 Tax=Aeromicrobium wangtongii TaxID=2969247 RepID=UPI0020170101|nr:SIMPL domain-containing protein [Aeromicrobium wangtongii]MCL3817027.1 SIMPL domain-containing protein [Aeromicrobium wangtongii]